MDKSDSEFTASLAEHRRQIDALDDRIIELLRERIGIVAKVGELKRNHFPGRCPIRPAREAEVVKRVMEKFNESPMLPSAAGAMWRTLIGVSTALEGNLSLSVYTGENNDAFWLAREYFGLFVPTAKHSQVKRVIGDVIDGKASVGIVPIPRGGDSSHWWTHLATPGSPKIFAVLPYIFHGKPSRDYAACLAVAAIAPEASGDDRSFWIIDAVANTSQHRLQSLVSSAGLDATWIDIAPHGAPARMHLVQIAGFCDPSTPAILRLREQAGKDIINLHFAGAHANPIIYHHNA